MTKTIRNRSLAVASVITALLAGCSSQPAEEPVRGKTAAERSELVYIGRSACTADTKVELAPQSGVSHAQTVCGLVQPDQSGAPLHIYLGIQYAESTALGRRWTDPLPPIYRDLRATEYGPRCPQGGLDDVNEDCLYLNVWTPKITPQGGGDLPVMVFIHGGAFISGSGGWAPGAATGHQNLYEGKQFVATSRTGGANVVFVTLNYRLGALGFLAGDVLGLSGNYGIKDQTAALQWVNRNIERFGGDPGNVMLFGESAGAQSTALHLTMPGDQTLFAKALTESNYAINYQTVQDAQGKADAFVSLAQCNMPGRTPAGVLACLRELSMSTVVKSQLFDVSLADLEKNGLQAILPWNPVIDHTVITQDPICASVTKPFIVGTNLNESIPFIGGLPFTLDIEWSATYHGLLTWLFGLKVGDVLAEYKPFYEQYGPKAALEQVVTDYLWTCFNRDFASTALHAGPASYRYHNVHHPSFPNWTNKDGGATKGVALACATSPNVCHADELTFVFGNATNDQSKAQTFSADEVVLSSALQNYWIQFARGSNPNAPGQTSWPLDSLGQLLQIQAPPLGMTVLEDDTFEATAHCKTLWDNIGYTLTKAGASKCPPSGP